ncbi:MAG: alpha/beta hydrolase [Alistipes sp.]|jgi:acetyl esterase/lipase|nr:alpha/beta hydrolase [Alistipes sp.]
MKKTLILVLALGFALTSSAQKTITLSTEVSGADEIVVLWDNTTAPHSNGITEDEGINDNLDMVKTTQTDLYIYRANPAQATGQGVVIVPGGGYRKLSMKYDGFMVAKYLREIGVSSIVVKYRMPNGQRDVPFEDILEAMRYMRREGVAWGVNPTKVGILGSSAGGYLAGHISTMAPDEEKPAFSILIYPVISGGQASHRGTFANMLGKWRTNTEHIYYSLENRVTKTTPPTLLLLADDDLTVRTTNGTAYYKALKRYGIPASMHVYSSGKHGWAGHDEWHYAEPCKAAIKDWLELMQNGIVRK